MKSILEQIVNVAFLFLGNKLKGYRAKIAAVITGILGAWGMIEKAFPDLCTNFGALCNVTESKWYFTVLTVMGVVSYILKKLDQIEISGQ